MKSTLLCCQWLNGSVIDGNIYDLIILFGANNIENMHKKEFRLRKECKIQYKYSTYCFYTISQNG